MKYVSNAATMKKLERQIKYPEKVPREMGEI
jgi:hypothetical protein